MILPSHSRILTALRGYPVSHSPSNPPPQKRVTTTNLLPTHEVLPLPRGWSAALQSSEIYLPSAPACAALEALYTALLQNIGRGALQQIDNAPEGSLRPAVYGLGELRFVLTSGTPGGTLGMGVLIQLVLVMRERVRAGRAAAWRGVLVHGSGQVWVVAVGTRLAWLGWSEMRGGG